MLNFPDFVAPNTEIEYEALLNRHIELKKLAVYNPIDPPCVLRIADRYNVPVKPASPEPARLFLPATLPRERPAVFNMDYCQADCDILLLQPLQTGYERWAQVWRGRLRSHATSGDAELESDVVVKLFHDGLCQMPYMSSEPADVQAELHVSELMETAYGGYWRAPSELARTEAWAFQKLSKLQGTILPWSYGFYKITMPGGEAAIGHIMECIHGLSLYDYLVEQQNDKTALWKWADSITNVFATIHEFGVVHLDIRYGNVFLVATDPLAFVVIDFALSEPRWMEGMDCRDKDVPDLFDLVAYTERTPGIELYDEWVESRMDHWDRLLDPLSDNRVRDFVQIARTKMTGRIPPEA